MESIFGTDAAVNLVADLVFKNISILSENMLPYMWGIFLVAVLLWGGQQSIKLALRTFNHNEFSTSLFFIIISTILLAGQGKLLIQNIYLLCITVMASASSIALSGISDIPEVKAVGSSLELGILAITAEKAVEQVIIYADTIFTSTGWGNPFGWLYAVLIVLPYIFLLILFCIQLSLALFRLMMVSSFAPFLFMAMAFGWGRQLLPSGIRLALGSIMVMFAVTVSLSLVIFALTELMTEDILKGAKDVGISNGNFWLVIALGWSASAFMLEAVGIANSIANINLTNTAAGTMAAGIMGTGAAIAGAQMGGVKNLAKIASSAEAQSDMVQSYRNLREGLKGSGWQENYSQRRNTID